MAITIQEPPVFDGNIYFEIHPLLDRKRKINLIAVYGKNAAGKSAFCSGLSSMLTRDSWRPQHYTSDMYFKYPRSARNQMLELAWQRFGPGEDYDAVQRDAFSIRSNMLEEDLRFINEGRGIYRESMYKHLSGELYGTLEIPAASRANTVIIMNGMWLSGFRKYFNAVIRVEAPYEVRRRRYEARVAKVSSPVFPWMFENLDRVIEEDIYKNWDVKDIVIRSDEGFHLQ